MDFPLPQTAYLEDNNYRPLKLLDPWLRGWDVFAVQTGLIGLGASLKADGVHGDRTDGAISDYQKDHGLENDHICGGVTMTSISAGYARRLNHHFDLPKGIPLGHFQKESSLLMPNYTAPYTEGTAAGSRDLGIVEENTRFYTPEHAFDMCAAGAELCSRILTYRDKYITWGVGNSKAWRLACGSWNAPAWTDALAKGEPLAPDSWRAIMDYINAVTAFANL